MPRDFVPCVYDEVVTYSEAQQCPVFTAQVQTLTDETPVRVVLQDYPITQAMLSGTGMTRARMQLRDDVLLYFSAKVPQQ